MTTKQTQQDGKGIALRIAIASAVLFLTTTAPRLDAEQRRPAGVQGLFNELLADCDEPAQRRAIIREAAVAFGERIRRIQKLLAEDRDEALEALDQVVDDTAELLELKEQDPAKYERLAGLYKLEDDTIALARKARASTGRQREQLIGQLKQRLAAYFDMKQDSIKTDILALEKEVLHLKQLYDRRHKRRGRLIDRKLEDMLEDEDAEW